MSNIIYYADESGDERQIFEEATKSKNTTVYTFENGNELTEAIENPPPKPQIVFVDLAEVSDGYKAVRKIRSRENFRLPIIIVSTVLNSKIVEKYNALGANLYIYKCGSRMKLKKAINYALGINWNLFRTTSKNFFYNSFLNR